MTWIDYWNRETTIYVSARHRQVHYDLIARDLLRYVPGPDARVVDYGCGDTLSARTVAARCGRLLLCESAETVRERLAARYADCPGVSVISPAQFAELAPGSIDTVIVNSVIQYLSLADLRGLLAVIRAKLAGGGRLVVGDVIPRHVGPLSDATQLIRLAAANGFLPAAVLGLARSALSSYPRVRRELGFLQLEEAEMLRELADAGFQARREPHNIGHSATRMTFVATPREGPVETQGKGHHDAAPTGP